MLETAHFWACFSISSCTSYDFYFITIATVTFGEAKKLNIELRCFE